MENFVHSIPTELYFGKGQISKLGDALNRFGKRVLLTYGGGSIKKMGLYDEVMKILSEGGFTVVECDGIEPNPRIESVIKGVKLCKENNIDVVLSVGGGSTLDCSKAIACGVYFEGDDLWKMVKSEWKLKKALPLVDILTLSATGSEFDGAGVISNMATDEKIGAMFTYPAVSICDPTYTFSVSKYQTAAGSADIMSHIMEGYFSRTDDCDISDGIAETVLKTVIKKLPLALREPDNYTARGNLMMASSVACSGIPEYGKQGTGWPCHGLEHELSAFYDITHGVGLAILTPRWMRHILKKDPSTTGRFVRFAKNVWGLSGGSEEVLALKALYAHESIFKESGIASNLTELNITEEYFGKMADHLEAEADLKNAYVPLTKEDIIEIYKACL